MNTIKIRRRRTELDSYYLESIFQAYLDRARENDNPNIHYEIEYKIGGKYYLVKYDLREVPMFDPADLVPVPKRPNYRDTSPAADGLRKEIDRREVENRKRVTEFVDRHITGTKLLKGRMGS